jgi:TolB protein
MAAALLLVACRDKSSTAVRASGSNAVGAAESGPAAALPGEIWFIEQRDPIPQRLVRLAAGKRVEIVGDFSPSRSRLSDGRLLAVEHVASRPNPDQLVLITTEGAVTRVGPTAKRLTNPIVGPDDSSVIVSLLVGEDSDLYRIELATGQMAQLTREARDNDAVALLGGDAIVFASGRDQDFALYRGSVKGGAATPLLAAHNWDYEPVLPPDRKTIAFTSGRDEGIEKVFLVDADGSHLRRLDARPASDGDEGSPRWSPDGKRIAYVNTLRGLNQVSIHDLASNSDRLVTPAGSDDTHPAWSPDGRWLLVARSPATGAPLESLYGDLWAIPVGGGPAIQLTRTPEIEFDPRWF